MRTIAWLIALRSHGAHRSPSDARLMCGGLRGDVRSPVDARTAVGPSPKLMKTCLRASLVSALRGLMRSDGRWTAWSQRWR